MSASKALEDGVLGGNGFCLIDEGEGKVVYAGKGVARCQTCGRHRKEFEASGRLGCPDCFTTFSDALAEMIKRMHRGTVHLGKIPAIVVDRDQLLRRREEFGKELHLAISRELYEEAAAIRDRIKEVEDLLLKVGRPVENRVGREMVQGEFLACMGDVEEEKEQG
ncbi:MAG: UvrB/UvrC motif-containing protein [Puniceicoccaceae bacterium]